MADDADNAGEQIAKEEAARNAAHRVMRESRPKESALYCLDCGDPISEERQRKAVGCDRCTGCQTDYDKGKL